MAVAKCLQALKRVNDRLKVVNPRFSVNVDDGRSSWLCLKEPSPPAAAGQTEPKARLRAIGAVELQDPSTPCQWEGLLRKEGGGPSDTGQGLSG